MPYAAVSLFSGAGGICLGAEQSGLAKTVWAVDLNSAATATYRKNLGNHVWNADITAIDEFPDVPCDILLAGAPCQDFSQIGTRDGIDGERGKLFREVSSFLDIRQPPAFIFENVPGLLSANKGKAWEWVRFGLKAPTQFSGRSTDESWPGVRYDLMARVINFAELGVPQNRKRLIVIGIRRDFHSRLIDLDRLTDKPVSVGEALARIPKRAPNNRPRPLSADALARMKMIKPGQNYSAIPEDHPMYVQGGRSHIYRRENPLAPANTVIAKGGGGSVPIHPTENRWMTDRELATLQGFPSSFEFVEEKEGDARLQIGNAVPPPAARALVTAVAEKLQTLGVPMRSDLEIKAARHAMAMAPLAAPHNGMQLALL